MLIEVAYEKGKELRFLSHLELMRAFERAVRRARLPIEYSHGFNPRPKIIHAAALGVGVSSEAERACIRLREYLPVLEIGQRLARALPKGLRVTGVRELPATAKPNYVLLDHAEYIVLLPECAPTRAELEGRIEELLSLSEIVIFREKEEHIKEVDIRPFIVELRLLDERRLCMVLKLGEKGQAKPCEVIKELGLAGEGQCIPWVHRTRYFAAHKGRRSARRRA